MKILHLLILHLVSLYAWSDAALNSVQPSSGCYAEEPYHGATGKLLRKTIELQDPSGILGNITRKYALWVPDGSQNHSEPLPIMFWFHGQYGNGLSDARSSSYTEYPMVQIYPQGLDDFTKSGGNCGTGWNVLSASESHDATTCDSAADGATCCYDSCSTLGVCTGKGSSASCGWASCYDDNWFVSRVLEQVANELCVDLNSVFVTGESNGGMLTHALVAKLPGVFRAALPVFGSPLVGHIEGVNATNKNMSILQLHDRSDYTIPVDGGEAGGWFYESAATVLGQWASLHGCAESDEPVTTPFDGGSTNLACTEWQNCVDGKLVMLCMYDGHHGDWPEQGEALTYWFFNSTRYLP